MPNERPHIIETIATLDHILVRMGRDPVHEPHPHVPCLFVSHDHPRGDLLRATTARPMTASSWDRLADHLVLPTDR